MKIICTQENLKTGLLVVGRIVSSNNTLPVLSNVLLRTENGLLKISSTNLEIAISTSVRCKTEEDGAVSVLAKTLGDLINNLPNENVVLETTQNKIKIETENYHTELNTTPAEEFPIIPTIEEKNKFLINGQELKTAIDQTIFAASSNQTQPEISGVLFKMEDGQIKIVATDRYRLAEKRLATKSPYRENKEVILPQKTIYELSRIIDDFQGEVELLLNQTQAAITVDQTQIISRLIDGQYPDYKQIIPERFATKIVAERMPLINGLKTGGIFSSSSNSVQLEFAEKSKLKIVSQSPELGQSLVELPCDVQGKAGIVVLNYHYILDSLNSLGSERVVLKINDNSSPTVIVPEQQSDYIYLVMPIKNQ